jgi:signal transduction histidine kinase
VAVIEGTQRRRSALFDLMITGIVAALSFVPGGVGLRPAVLAGIGLAMAAALLVRRRYPLPVLAVVSALGLAQVLFFPPSADPRPYDVAVLIAMYSVVTYSRPRWHAFLAAVPVTAGVVIEVHRHVRRDVVPAAPVRIWAESLIFLGGLCAAVWLTGYTIRTRRLYVAGLEERAATAERERDHLATIAVAQERATIARELHDVVAHSMAVMIVQADGAGYALHSDPAQAHAAIRQVAATGRDALEDMRRLVGVLRDGPADDPVDDPRGGGVDRRRVGLDQLTGLVDRARSAGLAVTVHADGARDGLPAAVALAVFRIVQEALTNVLRHAGAGARVELSLRYEPHDVRVEVTDDGGGRLVTVAPPAGTGRAGTAARAGGAAGPVAPGSAPGGHGLIGMRERVAVYAGDFEAGPRLGGGWRVAARVPWT